MAVLYFLSFLSRNLILSISFFINFGIRIQLSDSFKISLNISSRILGVFNLNVNVCNDVLSLIFNSFTDIFVLCGNTESKYI